MSSRNRPAIPKIYLVIAAGVAISITALLVTLSVTVITKTWKHMQLNDICPDYYSELYAYIVDQNRKPIDSVTVTLKDNSNFNVIYRTFTDKAGKFVLFNDFSSFALYNIPFSFELQISFHGYQDTVKYKFEKYRVCHFRKVEGPDTIVLTPPARNENSMSIEYGKKVAVEEVFQYAPFQEMALTASVPPGLKKHPDQWSKIKYGSLNIASCKVIIAISDSPLKNNTGSVSANGSAWYILDKNKNGDLNDDPVKPWNLLYSNDPRDIADCDLRQCYQRDTILIDAETLFIDLQLKNLQQSIASLYFRRGDALKAVVAVDEKRYRIVLWDRLFTRFADLRNVQIGVDLNDDSRFSSIVGDPELLETALSGVRFQNMICEIDSISSDGSMIYYNKEAGDKNLLSGSSVGTWAPDFNAFYAQPFSLYKEISNHAMVLLCFFEGNTQKCMEAVEMGAFITVSESRIKNIKVIGVNRKTIGKHYSAYPVIEENLGWQGSIVRQFHNHLDNEIICIDSAATIVCRGEPNKLLLESLWRKLGRKDLASAMSAFDKAIDKAAVIGTTVGAN